MIYIIGIIAAIILVNLVIYLFTKKIYFPMHQAINLIFFIIIAVIEAIKEH